MYLPDEKMDINKFQLVAIPTKSEFLARFGMASVPLKQFTEDEFARYSMNKIDSIADIEAYDEMMQREESKKQSNDVS